jgi:hypothetical protein
MVVVSRRRNEALIPRDLEKKATGLTLYLQMSHVPKSVGKGLFPVIVWESSWKMSLRRIPTGVSISHHDEGPGLPFGLGMDQFKNGKVHTLHFSFLLMSSASLVVENTPMMQPYPPSLSVLSLGFFFIASNTRSKAPVSG